VQVVVEAHDTPLRLLEVTPVGVGVVWMDQLVPFQRSANGWPVPEGVFHVLPTAVHVVVEVHDTLVRLLEVTPMGLGVAWIDQVVPSQRSARVLPSASPTAVHAVVEVHDTPFSRLLVAPVGLGTVWIDQVVPFQRSAKGTMLPALPRADPTAMQAVAEVHDTPLRSALSVTPMGLGVAWTDQVVPSQRSAMVPSPPEPTLTGPTAVQAVGEVHDTSVK
jgi:hypothetical protein